MIKNLFCPNCKKNIAEQLKNINQPYRDLYLPSDFFHDFKCNHCDTKLTASSRIEIKDIFGKPYLETTHIDVFLDRL